MKHTNVNASMVSLNKSSLQGLANDAFSLARDNVARQLGVIQDWSTKFSDKNHAAQQLLGYANQLARAAEFVHALECFEDGREELVINLQK